MTAQDIMARSNIAQDGELLRVEGLKTVFSTVAGDAIAVDQVSYSLKPGETLAVVGESGSGKSVTALSIMGLVPNPPGRIVGGEVWYRGRNLLKLKDKELESVRGAEIAMIFQEPMSSLNPVLTIGRQLTETIIEHQGMSRIEATTRSIEMLRLVQMPEPEKRMVQYPHQLSGGMLQRIMIAIALSCNPKVLIADEPTTALDVTIQAQILDLMRDLKNRFGTAIVLITHDLGVVAEMADRVIVMYAGRKVEEASVEAIFDDPRHPYTRGLLGALPHLATMLGAEKRDRLVEIPGIVPPLTGLPPGCHFAPRCPLASDRCRDAYPPFEEKAVGHHAACWES
jgi:oligopeptide/dipeptide ABC transporter ATP-binding protein